MSTKDTKDPKGAKSTKENIAQGKNSDKSKTLGDLLSEAVEEGDEKKPKKRPYFYFPETGLVFPFWAVVSIEADDPCVVKTTHTSWSHGIVINRGIESGPNMPFGEHSIYWESVEVRDKKLARMRELMTAHGYEINEV